MLRAWWRGVAKRFRRWRLLREIRAGRTVLSSSPSRINIELSGRCNVWPPCTYCVGKHVEGYVEPQPISDERLGQYMKYLVRAERVNDTTYGEPLMFPRIDRMIDQMGRAGVKFGFTSNGLLLTEKRAKLLTKHGSHVDICVSINAASKEMYYRHQGKDFDKLIENIDRYVRLFKQAHPGIEVPMILSFIVMRSNRHEVIDFIRLGRRLGVQGVLFRHLFDLHEDHFERDLFGHRFSYGEERLPFEEYQGIERVIRASDEFKRGGFKVFFAWNGSDSFIQEMAEPGIDIPCLYPWKFLCIRPMHGFYTPCVYMKKGIARTDDLSVDQVWNGEVMQGLRRDLAAGRVPKHCCENSDICPLVLGARAKDATSEVEAKPSERRVSLPVLAGA